MQRRYRGRPLTARMLECVLGITKQERLRWDQDGRLKGAHEATFKRGRSIQVRTYVAESVAVLANNPSLIASWRAQDAAAERRIR